MNLAQTGLAYDQFKQIGPLFQRLYVNKIPHPTSAHMSIGVCATYVVENQDGKRIFAKTVNVTTKEEMRGSYDMLRYPSAFQALSEHFNAEYIASDGLLLMQEYCVEHRGKADALEYSLEYGQEVYHSDLDELHMENDGFVNLQAIRARMQERTVRTAGGIRFSEADIARIAAKG